VTYASADKQLHADAPALMALKAAYADKGVRDDGRSTPARRPRDPVIADAKAAGLDMPDPLRLRAAGRRRTGRDRAAEVIVIDPRSWTIAYAVLWTALGQPFPSPPPPPGARALQFFFGPPPPPFFFFVDLGGCAQNRRFRGLDIV